MSKPQNPDSADTNPTAAEAASRRFSSRLQDGVHVISFSRSDVLDAHYIEKLGDDIYHFIKPVQAPRLVMDLGNVHHMSSAAIGMLIALRKVIDKKGGRICIANVSDDLIQVFKLLNLEKLMKIHDSTVSAVDSLG